jgi:hypothetical protein
MYRGNIKYYARWRQWSYGLVRSAHAPHQNAGRKVMWNLPKAVVEGETPTPFKHAAMTADLTK